MNHIHVYLPTDEDRLLPRGSRWIEKDSVAAYQRQIEWALAERWPGVEVDVTTYYMAHELLVDTDVDGVDTEVVRAIAEEVWARFDWIATDVDPDGRYGFIVTEGTEVFGDFEGYATLADAKITASERYEGTPRNIWFCGEIVATYPEAAQ